MRLVHLYDSDGTLKQVSININYWPFAVLYEGNFYIHASHGTYAPVLYYTIPSPIEEES